MLAAIRSKCTALALTLLVAGCGAREAPRLRCATTDLAHTTFAPALAAPFDATENTLWCASLALAWDELVDVLGGPVVTDEPNATVPLLNDSPVSRDDVRNADLVARAGRVRDGVVDAIQADLRETFGEEDPGLATLSSSLDVALVAYARIEGALSFEHAFDDLEGEPLNFGYVADGEARTRRVDAFGIVDYDPADDRDSKRARQVEVLYHADDGDFVVRLIAEDTTDRLLVARVPAGATLAETWSAVADRAFGPDAVTGGLEPADTLVVPEIDFDLAHRFEELEGVHVVDGDAPALPIASVLQDLRLRFDEEGMVVRSRAEVLVASAVGTAPRRFVCDGPFLVALIEEEARSPWLLAWIVDPEVLSPE